MSNGKGSQQCDSKYDAVKNQNITILNIKCMTDMGKGFDSMHYLI